MCQKTMEFSSDAKIQLIGFPRINKTLLAGSPFVGKLEVMLRLAGLPYSGYTGSPADKKVAPRGKLPSMKHGKDFVTDSAAITRYLCHAYPKQMAQFTPSDPKLAARAAALQRMLEEHTYFAVLYWLWADPQVSSVFVPRMINTFGLPWPLRGIVRRSVHKEMLRNLHGQGIERMTLAEVNEKVGQDFDVCEEFLADSPFLTGDSPTAADCFLFALLDLVRTYFLHASRRQPVIPSSRISIDGSLQCSGYHGRVWQHISSRPHLLALYNRMKDQVFPSGSSLKHWQTPFNN